MSMEQITLDDNLGYTEFYVNIKVKHVVGYLGDGNNQQLVDSYKNVLESGELSAYVEKYISSLISGSHVIDDVYDLGLIDTIEIEVSDNWWEENISLVIRLRC